MRATKQYFSVALLILLYLVVLTFESVDEILKCDHSNESYWAVLFCGSNFPKTHRSHWKLSSITLKWCCLFFYIFQVESCHEFSYPSDRLQQTARYKEEHSWSRTRPHCFWLPPGGWSADPFSEQVRLKSKKHRYQHNSPSDRETDIEPILDRSIWH